MFCTTAECCTIDGAGSPYTRYHLPFAFIKRTKNPPKNKINTAEWMGSFPFHCIAGSESIPYQVSQYIEILIPIFLNAFLWGKCWISVYFLIQRNWNGIYPNPGWSTVTWGAEASLLHSHRRIGVWHLEHCTLTMTYLRHKSDRQLYACTLPVLRGFFLQRSLERLADCLICCSQRWGEVVAGC